LSAGLDPQPITEDKHLLPDYWTSRELYDHPRLAHLPRSADRRGDLVFWRGNETGTVNHVAIYLGGGNVLEAVEPWVRNGSPGDRSTQTMMPEVVRPFSPASPAASTAATEPRSTSPYATCTSTADPSRHQTLRLHPSAPSVHDLLRGRIPTRDRHNHLHTASDSPSPSGAGLFGLQLLHHG
jgi:hypothetical protein